MIYISEFIQIMNALADNNRYTIIKELLRRDYCVGGLALKLSISEAAVSQHLKILKEAGLITGEKRGYFKHYRVNKMVLSEVGQELIGIAEMPRENQAQCPPSKKEDCPLCREKLLENKTK